MIFFLAKRGEKRYNAKEDEYGSYRSRSNGAGRFYGAADGATMGVLTVCRTPFYFSREVRVMTQVLRGNIVHAPKMGELSILEHGCLVLEDGVIQAVCPDLPRELEGAELRDYGDRLLMQSFVDMHLHAPQYPMLGMGMDLQLLDWLNTYTFPTEAPVRRHGLRPQGVPGGWPATSSPAAPRGCACSHPSTRRPRGS